MSPGGRSPGAGHQLEGPDAQDRRHQGADTQRWMGRGLLGRFLLVGVQQHDHEEHQHHDGAGIDDDLEGGGHGVGEQQEEPRHADEGEHQAEARHDEVLLPEHRQGAEEGDEGEGQEHGPSYSATGVRGTAGVGSVVIRGLPSVSA